MRFFQAGLYRFYIILISSCYLCFCVIYYFEIRNDFRENIDLKLKVIAENLVFTLCEGKLIHKEWQRLIDEETFSIDHQMHTLIQVKMFAGKKLEIMRSVFMNKLKLPDVKKDNSPLYFRFEVPESNLVLRIFVVSQKTPSGGQLQVQVATPLNAFESSLDRHIIYLSLGGTILLLLFGYLGYRMMSRNMKTLHRIISEVRVITARDLSKRLKSDVQDYDELVIVMNDMIRRLEQSFDQFQGFSANASHELKTPLTAMRGEIEVTLRKGRNPDEYVRILHKLSQLVQQMEEMIQSLFFLSSLDSGNIPYVFTEASLDDLLMDEWEQLVSRLEKKLYFHIDSITKIRFPCIPLLMRRLFSNLIGNAIKYTPAQGEICLSLVKEGRNAVFIISDTGEGIAEEDQEKIFQRFYRVDPSRSRKSGGVGLGLAIVDWIVKIHGGSIRTESAPGKGTTFVCRFPS